MMSPLDQRNAYIEYLLMKVQQADWHGVSDTANDLRELEAKYPALKSEEVVLNRVG